VGTLALGCLAGSVAARCAGYPFATLLARCDGLALGALLAALLHRPEIADDDARRAAVRPWIRAAGAIVAMLGVRLAWEARAGRVRVPLGYRLDDAPAEVLCVSLIAFMIVAWTTVETGDRRLAPLRWKPLRDLGTISYGLYLYHALVLHAVEALLPRSVPGYRVVEGLLTLGGSLAVAALSWQYVERPILKLKDRFDYRSDPIEPGRAVAGAGAVGASYPLMAAGD
jgi:peptidoglycan/LPS O-acetylase OafA/YrhL